MICFGVCHAASFFSYTMLLKAGAAPQILSVIIFCEAFTGGCVTTAFLTFIYTTCKTGSIYALLWALHEVSGIFFMSISGVVADKIGWNLYFMLVPLGYVMILTGLCRCEYIHIKS
jgi:uncharacterized membrane protein